MSMNLAVAKMGKPLKGQIVLFWPLKVPVLVLSLENPGSRQRGNTHAVTDKDDDILGNPGVVY